MASVVPGDGAVNNLFGGLDYVATEFGYADRGLRQPGSAFKPFVYMAALRDGIDPRSAFDGRSGRRLPCYGDRPVNNYAGEDFGGSIDVDSAMVRSVNVVFVEHDDGDVFEQHDDDPLTPPRRWLRSPAPSPPPFRRVRDQRPQRRRRFSGVTPSCAAASDNLCR